MLVVFALAAGIWGLGYAMKTPQNARWLMIGLLYVVVLAIHVVLPEGNALRMATGGSAAVWLGLAVLAGLIYGYSHLIKALRSKAQLEEPVAATQLADTPSETELERYARHIVLREIGGAGQMRLRKARVLVIGAGGLGAPALLYLGAAGVGTLGVIDDDVVEAANLQRQIIHSDARIGMPKVFSAQAEVEGLNPYCTVKPYHRRLTPEIADELIAEYDLVLDGSDNFDTRYLVNAAAVRAGTPLISGALSQWEGQISVFDPAQDAPCYACVFPAAPEAGLAPSCAEAGVLGPLPGVIGAMMAAETVKVLTGAGVTLRGAMLIYDALDAETRRIALKPRAGCAVCGAR